MNDCIFCKIVKGEIPANKIYEDEHAFVFLDAHPTSHGHSLVIPKNHFQDIHTIPDEELTHLISTVKKIATALKKGLPADGINLVMNNGTVAGQLVFHAHIHVIPRYGDIFEDHERPHVAKKGETEETIKKIRGAM